MSKRYWVCKYDEGLYKILSFGVRGSFGLEEEERETGNLERGDMCSGKFVNLQEMAQGCY